MKTTLSNVLILLSCFVSACGGGGGGGSSTGATNLAPIAITTANQKAVASLAVNGGVAGTDGSLPTGLVAASSAQAPARLSSFLLRTFDSLKGQELPIPSGVIITPAPDQCVPGDTSKGTLTTSLDDADNNGTASIGDAIIVVYANCFDPVSTETSTGTVRFKLSEINRTSSGSVMTFKGRYSLSAFQISQGDGTSVSISGSLDFEQDFSDPNKDISAFSGTIVFDLANDKITINDLINHSSTDKLTNGYEEYGAATINSQKLAGSIRVETSSATPQVGTKPNPPASGVIKITGANSALTLTAVGSGNVRLDVDTNNDLVTDNSETVAWTSLQ